MKSKILCPNKKYWFDVEVSPLKDALAQVSPIYTLKPPGYDVKPGSIGIIKFHDADCFSAEILSHEAVHCATTYIRLFETEKFENDKFSLIDEINDNEECLAYHVGYFAQQLTDYFYKYIN